MAYALTNCALRMLATQTSSVCQACGRPMFHAPANFFPARTFGRAGQSGGPRTQSFVSGGNPDVMRKFQELQSKKLMDDLDELDDFADDYASSATGSDEFNEDDVLSAAESTDARVAAQFTLPVELPPPRKSKVTSARYVSSAVSLEACPKLQFPEFAVIGRSNVGKSSLINMLTNSKGLALVSKQPGKTKCINHFLINEEWWLVDLPGYGYAKSAKEERLKWNNFTKDYFLQRETLMTVLLLIDASIPPQQVDLDCASWMADAEVPFAIVFTKVDKKKKGSSAEENMAQFLQVMEAEMERLPPHFVTSSVKGIGRLEVLGYLSSLRQLFTAATPVSAPFSGST